MIYEPLKPFLLAEQAKLDEKNRIKAEAGGRHVYVKAPEDSDEEIKEEVKQTIKPPKKKKKKKPKRKKTAEDKMLLSITEAKELTGLARRKIMFYVKTGKLPYIDTSEGLFLARYKFNRKTLINFIKSLEVTTPQ